MVKKPYFFIQWDATNVCNLKCTHCYHTDNHTKDPKELTTLEAMHMLDDLNTTATRWGMQPAIHFSGGEPLLRKDLFDLARYSFDRNFRMRLLSNGTLITDAVARDLQNVGFTIVQISLDGTEQTHNKIRGDGSFEAAINGISALKRQGLSPTISTTVMQSNLFELEEIIRVSYEAGADRIGFTGLVSTNKDRRPKYLTREEIFLVYKELAGLKEEYKNKIAVLTGEPLWCLLQPESLIQKFGRELDKITSGCSIGVNGLSVLADGTVYPCRRLPIPIANIREQTIAEIFIENSLLNQFRDFHNLKDCGECNNVTYCRGCRAIAYAVTGSAFAGDPQCFKELISI